MKDYETLMFHHANLRTGDDKPLPVDILLGRIAGFHWSNTSKATYIYTNAGIMAVLETPEQVREIINKAKGGDNGN